MRNIGRAIKTIVQNPYLGLGTGGAIILTSLSGVLKGFDSMQGGFHLDSSHGVLLYGCIHMLKALGDLTEGVEQVDEDKEKVAVEGNT